MLPHQLQHIALEVAGMQTTTAHSECNAGVPGAYMLQISCTCECALQVYASIHSCWAAWQNFGLSNGSSTGKLQGCLKPALD